MPLELLFPLNIGNNSELLLTTLFITTRSIVIQMAWGYTNSFPKRTIEVQNYLQCLQRINILKASVVGNRERVLTIIMLGK